MNLAPIALFAYHRPQHVKETVKALLRNDLASKSTLYCFVDGPKNERDVLAVQEVKTYLQNLQGFAQIHHRFKEQNQGLATSIIQGVSEVLEQYPQVIVMEDDLISAADYLNFMNEGLSYYQGQPQIRSISGFSPIQMPSNYAESVYFSPRPFSWGWATWRDAWQEVDWEIKDFKSFLHNASARQAFNRGGDDLSTMLTKQMLGKIDSWAIRWAYHHYKTEAYSVCPAISKIQNIGLDGSGTHQTGGRSKTPKVANQVWQFSSQVHFPMSLEKRLKRFFQPSIFRKMINRWLIYQAQKKFA